MKKKKPGFTLMEMIITLGLTVTLIGIAGSMFTIGNKVFSDSDVKTTLQIEGQAIQEKISDIGMQATGVVEYDNGTDIKKITIQSYNKYGNKTKYNIEYKKSDGKLSIDNNIGVLSTHVQSLEVIPNIFEIDNKNELNNIKLIKFKIQLGQSKGVSNINSSNYPPVLVSVNFRNKNIKED